MNRRLALGTVAAAIVALVTACAPSAPTNSTSTSGSSAATGNSESSGAPESSSSDESAPGTDAATPSNDTLTIATTTDVVNYNPLVGNSRSDYWITNLMYPHLLSIGDDGKKTGALAEKWGYVDDMTGYYEINPDFTWSDGKPLTAADVAYTFNAAKKDKPAGLLPGYLASMDTATAVSDTRVEVKLAKPDATLIEEAGYWGNIVPQHVFEPAGSVAEFANDKNWVSAGPFVLTDVQRGQSYTLKRVDHYPLAPGGVPTIETIVYKVYPDVNTEMLALRSGAVDVIANAIPPSQVESLQSESDITVSPVPGLGYAQIAYNLSHKPLDDIKVREALASVVDREAIRQVVLRGQAKSTGSIPVPPVLTEFTDPSFIEYTFDIDHARSLLESAGYKADSAGNYDLTLTMIYSLQDPVTAQWATMVKDNAAKAGITIDLKGMERNTYLQATNDGEYDLYAGNFAIVDDMVSGLAVLFKTGGVVNYSHVDNADLNALIDEAAVTLDRTKQLELVKQGLHTVHDNYYADVLYSQDLYIAHNKAWTDFIVQPSELSSILNPQSLAQAHKVG